MKTLEQGLTRRGLLRRLALAASVGPIAVLAVSLTSKVAAAEQRRRHHRGPSPDEIWIGHC